MNRMLVGTSRCDVPAREAAAELLRRSTRRGTQRAVATWFKAPMRAPIVVGAFRERSNLCHFFCAGEVFRLGFVMTVDQVIGLSLALFVMCIGLAGSILPGIPSTPLVLLVAIGHRLWFGQAGASNLVLIFLGLLMVASLVMDYLASMYGAKRLGATWRGVLGAVVGGLIGIFFALPGILIGPFLGALAFEVMGGREWKQAARAGLGAVIGLFVGALGKLACCAAMIGLFAFSVVMQSLRLSSAETVASLTK